MRTNLFSIALSLLVILGLATSAQAQQLVDYTYKQYNLGFKAPVGFNIKTNTASQFTIDNGKSFTFSIYPYKDASVEDALSVAKVAYNKINATNKNVEEEEELEMNGYEGYYFVGSGTQNGKELIFVAVGALDRDSDVNFYGIAMFWADSANVDSDVEMAIKLITSFTKK